MRCRYLYDMMPFQLPAQDGRFVYSSKMTDLSLLRSGYFALILMLVNGELLHLAISSGGK